jgi:hypothetical protein
MRQNVFCGKSSSNFITWKENIPCNEQPSWAWRQLPRSDSFQLFLLPQRDIFLNRKCVHLPRTQTQFRWRYDEEKVIVDLRNNCLKSRKLCHVGSNWRDSMLPGNNRRTEDGFLENDIYSDQCLSLGKIDLTLTNFLDLLPQETCQSRRFWIQWDPGLFGHIFPLG